MLSVNSIHISQLYVSHTVTIAFLSVAKFSKSDHKDRPGVDISGILSTHKISENGYRWLLGTEKILEVGYRWVTGTVEISKDGYRWIPGTSQWKNFWYRWVLGTGQIFNDVDTWTDFQGLFKTCFFIVRSRIGQPYLPLLKKAIFPNRLDNSEQYLKIENRIGLFYNMSRITPENRSFIYKKIICQMDLYRY